MRLKVVGAYGMRLFQRVLVSRKAAQEQLPKLKEETRWSDDCGRVDQSMTWKLHETEMSHMGPRATLRRA
jgi:hypothetical protein